MNKEQLSPEMEFVHTGYRLAKVLGGVTLIYLAGNYAGEYLGSDILNIHNWGFFASVGAGILATAFVETSAREMEKNLREKESKLASKTV